MKNCNQCGYLVPNLFDTGNLQYGPGSNICIKCIHLNLGITTNSLEAEERARVSNENDFFSRLLKGRIGQVIIENIFRRFGFEVYPYGYESYFTNIIKRLKEINNDRVVNQVRETPDLFVFDQVEEERHLFEIKSSDKRGLVFGNEYTMDCHKLHAYINDWPSSSILIVNTLKLEFFAVKYRNLVLDDIEKRESSSGEFYVIKMYDHLMPLWYYAGIDQTEYESYLETEIRPIVKKFGNPQ